MIIEIKVPAIGESVTEVTLSAWLVKEGDYVLMDQPICELESDKATMELPAEKSGKIHLIATKDSDLKIGELLCTLDTSATAENSVTPATPIAPKQEMAAEKGKTDANPKVENTTAPTYSTSHPSPAADKILREKGIPANEVKATGVDGRITKEDALKASKTEPAVNPNSSKEVASSSTGLTNSAGNNRNTRREKMSRLRRTIAAHLVHAKNDTAMLTTFNEVDLTEIMAIRAKFKDSFKEKHGVGLGFMSFFAKACSQALIEIPAVNAKLDMEDIVYHDFVDMSVAVSTPRGLVTPIIRNVETMNLIQLEKAVMELAVKGRDNKLTMDDLDGGTFTISNGGVFGSLLSTPIINAPQTAILGMHKIQERAMVINGEIKARPMMYLALSYDHRIIDGKEAVTFLVRVKELLEDPIRMMVGM